VNVGPLKNFRWSARDASFTDGDTKWANGEPSANGDCVSLELRNTTGNTWLAAKNCAEKKKFICEVKLMIYSVLKHIESFLSLQLPKEDGMGVFALFQCAETWNVTEGNSIQSFLN